MLKGLREWLDSRRRARRFWAHYGAAEGDDFIKSCYAILISELSDKTLGSIVAAQPVEQQPTFWIAYACFLVGLFREAVQARANADLACRLTDGLFRNLQKHRGYDSEMLWRVWSVVDQAMPDALTSVGPETGVRAPWVRIVEATNRAGFSLNQVSSFSFMIYIEFVCKRVYGAVNAALVT